ncbi:histidine--tRNA ligase [Companilactobacillus sp. RD055328]|uniref:histidine--tRNA ligase n=1 Tax=Companilactobacillus sp. RD055328 TaxID=2916634 RepID=UPI001FC8244E|nr:histidine--tRNA ligase [Companilactobacillus sp. RD055328]GKQ42650.1 histidine--tRNA ligase [Companilactobacillus sp. RD055328]
MNFQKPKGTMDILPGESKLWQYVENTAEEVFSTYRFEEIRTPIFEQYEVFQRSSGETSDIVSKEMYDFEDKGNRRMALRPEGTAGVVRAYVENKLFAPEHVKPVKVWYKGPMFRYERPQSGRQRQFHQIGVEAFGSTSPDIDADTIAMAINFLSKFNINEYKLAINTLGDSESREKYHNALINYLTPFKEELSDDSKRRLEQNPLRILDSKDKKDQEIVANAPSILDFLTEESQLHFDRVKSLLEVLNIDYIVDSNMVRGLDYYNHTIFEVMVTDKAFDNKETTVIAGGRYNGLVEELGGPETPGFGFGMGIERLMLLIDDDTKAKMNSESLDVFITTLDENSATQALVLLDQFRKEGLKADRDFLDRKVKGQFKMANNLHSKFVITLGEEELTNKKAPLKNMETGEQVEVEFDHLANKVKELMGDN